MKDIVFSETQRFKQWWLWIIMAGIIAHFLYGCYVQLITGTPWGNNPLSNTALIIITLLVVLLVVSYGFIRLNTFINKDGIYVRLFPFQLKHKFFAWENIDEVFLRTYSPLKEFGGWGYRVTFKNGTAFNVSGNVGLQVTFKNSKKRVLIGTQRSEDMRQILSNLGKIHKEK